MKDALQRLQELQKQLESLRRTTEKVIAESQQLIDDIQDTPAPPVPVRRSTRLPRKRASARR